MLGFVAFGLLKGLSVNLPESQKDPRCMDQVVVFAVPVAARVPILGQDVRDSRSAMGIQPQASKWQKVSRQKAKVWICTL